MAIREPQIRVERGNGSRSHRATWEEQPPVGELFRKLSDDAQTLIRQEVALGKAEIRETASVLGRDAAKIAVAVGVAAVGALAATAFLILALGALIESYWISALIVTVVFFAIAAVLGIQAKNDIQKRDLKPTRTINTLEADADWAKREVAEVKRDWKS